MRMPKFLVSLLVAFAVAGTSVYASAQDAHGHDEHAAEDVDHGAGIHDEDAHDAPAAHGGGHHHVPTLDDFNWYFGMVGESDVEEPSLLWRPKGMPVPFAAMLLNSAVLFWLLIRFAKKPIAEGLKNLKANILRGMDEAAKMKKDAETSLAEYKDKLENIEQEIERVRREMREAGEQERARILAEAREKRTRMERDARILIEQELKAAREILIRETVRGALVSAETELAKRITAADQQRMAEDYLKSLKQAAQGLRGKV